jgi:hypothetical protein
MKGAGVAPARTPTGGASALPAPLEWVLVCAAGAGGNGAGPGVEEPPSDCDELLAEPFTMRSLPSRYLEMVDDPSLAMPNLSGNWRFVSRQGLRGIHRSP